MYSPCAQLIVESDYNISEIATITGFNDVKNFSKRFKELYKLTPTQYKQESKDKVIL
jgi:transcriptional regulator GlxA family with amidase domain